MNAITRPSTAQTLAIGGFGLLLFVVCTYLGYILGFIAQVGVALALDPSGQSFFSVIPTPYVIVPWIPLCFSACGSPLAVGGLLAYRSQLTKNPAQGRRAILLTLLGFLVSGCLLGFIASLLFTPAAM